MKETIKFTCQACGKTIELQPNVYIAYVGKKTCLDCRSIPKWKELKVKSDAKNR